MTTLELAEWTGRGGLTLDAAQVTALASSDEFIIRPDRSAAGRWFVGARHFLGVAQFGDLEVRVQPKVKAHRLVELLVGGQDLVRWDEKIAPDLADSTDLLGFVATSFARHASDALRPGMLQGYRHIEEALPAVRGRILAGAQLSRRAGLPLPVELGFDEFTTDILENQLLAGATRLLLLQPSLGSQIRTRLRRIGQQLFDVTPTRATPSPPVVDFNRLNERYRAAIALARLILQACSLEDGQGQRRGIGFLIDMNRVFEDAVGEGLRPYLGNAGLHLELQSTFPLDTAEHLSIRPDVICRGADGRICAVADIKYKQPDTSGISTNDVYQVLAYAHRFKLDTVHLIYAAQPPVRTLQIGAIVVRNHWVDLSTAGQLATDCGSVAYALNAPEPAR